jgi:hypothetical protein
MIFVDQEHRPSELYDKQIFRQYVEPMPSLTGYGTTFNPNFSTRFHELSMISAREIPRKTKKLFDMLKYSRIFEKTVPKHIRYEALTLFKKLHVGCISSDNAFYLACLKVVTRSRNVYFNLKNACDISNDGGNYLVSVRRVNRVILKTTSLSKIKPADKNTINVDLV